MKKNLMFAGLLLSAILVLGIVPFVSAEITGDVIEKSCKTTNTKEGSPLSFATPLGISLYVNGNFGVTNFQVKVGNEWKTLTGTPITISSGETIDVTGAPANQTDYDWILTICSSITKASSTSGKIDAKKSKAPKGWEPVEAADGSTCYNPTKRASAKAKIIGLFIKK